MTALRLTDDREPCLEADATRSCALLVGLPDVVVVGVAERRSGAAHHGDGHERAHEVLVQWHGLPARSP
jgi:hypothetical protein